MKELHLTDNLVFLKYLYKKGYTSFIDLIYIDPPFNSKRNYNIIFDAKTKTSEVAFSDIWSNVSYLDELEEINSISPNLFHFLKMLESTGLPKSYISYLTAMAIRCWYMRHTLKETGSFYYHCDETCGAYVKIMLDYIFGLENHRNTIIWKRHYSHNDGNKFGCIHDVILFYTKTNDFIYNKQFLAYDDDYIKKNYSQIDEKTNKRYRSVSMNAAGQGEAKYFGDALLTPPNGTHWRWGQERINEALKNEIIFFTKNNVPRYKQFLEDIEGINIQDTWDDFYSLSSHDKERLGYPTQKPEALLERIIKASSPEGGVVADFYMGGGTTLAVAQRLGREWIGSDINYRAVQITKERIEKLGLELKKDFFIFGTPKSSVELRQLVNENIMGREKNSRFALEEVIVKFYLKNVTGNEKKVGDNSIDGVFGFTVGDVNYRGLVQVTSGSNKNHLKAFCSEVAKTEGQIGVYITFADCVTDGFTQEVKSYGKVFGVDRIQILTIEDLVDNGIQPVIP